MLTIKGLRDGESVRPLGRVEVTGPAKGIWIVRDGLGREYLCGVGKAKFAFRAAGALGRHTVQLLNEDGRMLGQTTFRVDCKTEIRDEGGIYGRLLQDAHWTLATWTEGYAHVRYGPRIYHFFHYCLRDNTHAVKGMKWFHPSVKDAVDLNAAVQRRDGMIWDTVKKPESFPSYWDMVFGPKGFMRQVGDPPVLLHRTPVEADLEYLFVLALHQAWQVTGDDGWMASRLENAIRAIRFVTTSPYYWSRKYRLIKRAYTIDTWDYQYHEDVKITGHSMMIDPAKTRFNVMHGDNTGLAEACRCLSDMLQRVGRGREAARYARLGQDILDRLSKLAWNGHFFRHQVPEDSKVKRDLGVDETTQVSLSNTYALNRGISHEQAVAIIRTYQRLRREMPAGAPAEWFMIYPPFPHGYDEPGEYMNGGVSTIAAGELAHGAFTNGCEDYGADILRRIEALGRPHGGYLNAVLRGHKPRPPQRTFVTLDLRSLAHVDFRGTGAPGVTGWTGEGKNDLAAMPTGRRVFQGVPFDVIAPAQNHRRACLGIAQREGYRREVIVPVGRKAACAYLLHTASDQSNPTGVVVFRYVDGTQATVPISSARVSNWWMPGNFDKDPGWWPQQDRLRPWARVAWRGKNAVCPDVGVFVCGVDNPQPEKVIADLALQAWLDTSLWFVLGITLCSAKTWFDPGTVSHGIPDDWGAGAVAYALIEGLAGVKDTGKALDHALVAPRWSAAGVKRAQATIKYEASGGYVHYRYQETARALSLELTGTAEEMTLEILLPHGKKAKVVQVDGKETAFRSKKIEKSAYVCLNLKGLGAHQVQVQV